jgi:hypothetical protein
MLDDESGGRSGGCCGWSGQRLRLGQLRNEDRIEQKRPLRSAEEGIQ